MKIVFKVALRVLVFILFTAYALHGVLSDSQNNWRDGAMLGVAVFITFFPLLYTIYLWFKLRISNVKPSNKYDKSPMLFVKDWYAMLLGIKR